jgi:hypothetical protein
MKVFGSRYSQGCLLRRRSTGTQSVEDMVASLPRTLFTDTRLLQQVMRDKTTNDFRLGKRSIDLAVNRFSQGLRPQNTQWAYCLITKILISTNLDKNFTTA